MKQIIPISMINERKNSLIKSNPREISIQYETVLGLARKNSGYNEIRKYFRECVNTINANSYWKNCLNIINELSKDSRNANILNEIENIFVQDILPRVYDIHYVVEYTNSYMNQHSRDKIIPKCKVLLECDRVLNNNNKLSSRYNFNQIIKENESLNLEDTIETLCELIDTYKFPVHAKLNIALENILYSYHNAGIHIDKTAAIQYITEYFLRYNDILTDSQYSKIKEVLESNKFISKEEISNLYYIFTEQESFKDKVIALTNEIENKYKLNIETIGDCKSVSEAKEVIRSLFTMIYRTFIVSETVPFFSVAILITSIFSLVIKFSSNAKDIIETIEIENAKIDVSKLSEEEKARAERVKDFVRKNLDEIKFNPVKESAIIIDNLYDSISIAKKVNNNLINENDLTTKSIINIIDYVNDSNILESKDFADSSDVKDIINKYKAEQNKTLGRLRFALSHIYTKKPEKIIDDTPNILEFIRNFGILSTLAIHPVVALVVFCVDKYIEMGLKRKEAERVLKYFKSEKLKVEKKLDKMAFGEKRDRLEDYAKCLDKAIDKLETYRDNLYSDTELDKIKELEEASSVNWVDKVSVEEYFNNIHHEVICNNVNRAIQLFYNEFMRRFSGPYIQIDEYELYDGEDIVITLRNIDEVTFLNNFVTPDGIIDIPLFRIKYQRPDSSDMDLYHLYNDIEQSCEFVDELLAKTCTIRTYLENDNIFIIFNFLRCLYVEDREEMEYSATQEIREQMAKIIALSEMVEDIWYVYPTVTNIINRLDRIPGEEARTLAKLVASSKCVDTDKFIEILKDIQSTTDDPILSTNIMMTIGEFDDIIKEVNKATLIESSIIQAESVKILNEIAKELKKGNKNPVNTVREKINSEKKKFGNVVDKAQKGKVSITTNLALASQLLKKKMKDLSTKEKEISKNIDVSLSYFKKNLEKALTTNRREAIIKGSVIPSFSKIIKLGLAAGGVYLVNPVIAAIGVFGAFACSKALTRKERIMLLDEIDVELKAVDKELSIAESDGDMKKYRQLLTYQRKLQREKQRLQYRIKLANQDVPKPKEED